MRGIHSLHSGRQILPLFPSRSGQHFILYRQSESLSQSQPSRLGVPGITHAMAGRIIPKISRCRKYFLLGSIRFSFIHSRLFSSSSKYMRSTPDESRKSVRALRKSTLCEGCILCSTCLWCALEYNRTSCKETTPLF